VAHTGPAEPFSANGDNNADAIEPCVTPALLQVVEGVRFADRPVKDSSKRPVREIVSVDPALNQRWSTPRVLIKDRQGKLASKFNVIIVGRRPRWKPCSWRSRPPWKPGRPSTNHAP
jgi:hypothetical protein